MNNMNRKSFYFVIFLVFVLLLSGCTGVTPTTPGTSADIIEIKGVLYEYFSALSSQNWNKAKNLCVYGGDQYYKTIMMENGVNDLYQLPGNVFESNVSNVTIFYSIYVSNVSVSNNYAMAQVSGKGTICVDYYNCVSDNVTGTFQLQKTGNSWKII